MARPDKPSSKDKSPAALWTTALAAYQSGRLATATRCCHDLLKANPQHHQARHLVGQMFARSGDYRMAVEWTKAALAIDSVNTGYWTSLALALAALDRFSEAEAACRSALGLDPDCLGSWLQLGQILFDTGDLGGAEAAFERAVALDPENASTHSRLLSCLTYDTDRSAEAIFEAYRRWDERHARPLLPVAPGHDPGPDPGPSPGRRLRVGYVLTDIRDSAAGSLFAPLLAAHDRGTIELFCYSEGTETDKATAYLLGMVEHWQSIAGMDDQTAADRIRADRIDVLVDLNGHSANSRLMVFARKPAPVQVNGGIGTGGGNSGLSAMDAVLADDESVPPGFELFFNETVVRLPRLPLAFRPPAGMPDVMRLPAWENGYVTFGSLCAVACLNDRVIGLWARLLHAVPDSRLLINDRSLQEEAGRERLRGRFAAHGIEPDQLSLACNAPGRPTWETYQEIDLVLDPFPHGSVITTLESLWMGVPVLTLADRPPVGRVGAGILAGVGLKRWVALTPDDYLAVGVAVATNLDRLDRLRRALRARVAASPLADPEALARTLESAYRELWQRWRETAPHPDPPARAGPPKRDLMVAAFQNNDLATARGLCTEILASLPADGEALHVLGLIEYMAHEFDRAIGHIQEALAAGYVAPEVLFNFGAVLRGSGRLAEAEAAYRWALELRPDFVDARNNLGDLLRDLHRPGEAVAAFTAALQLAPKRPEIICNLAGVLLDTGAFEQAEAVSRTAIALAPDSVDAWFALARALVGRDRLFTAHQALVRALALQPGSAPAYGLLGEVEQRFGRLPEAERALRAAVTLRPDHAPSHSALLVFLDDHPDRTAEEIFAEHRRWDERFGAPSHPPVQPHDNDRNPERRLRIGLLSAGFRDPATAPLIAPLLAAHDRRGVDLFCYDSGAITGTTADVLHDPADHWRPVATLAAPALADLIRLDRIDVLVDFDGHAPHGRPTVFGYRPAPVQIAYPVGRVQTSGLAAMDAILLDETQAPASSDPWFSEQVVRLPRTPVCWALPETLPAVGPLPALSRGTVTFGVFAGTEFINDPVIRCWASLLMTVPSTRLVLYSPLFAEDVACALFRTRFVQCGIAADRIDLKPAASGLPDWPAFHDIDIVLDPFPHSVGAVTLAALSMGVPVVTLSARPPGGRTSASILKAAGLPEWIATSPEGYAMFAGIMVSDLDGLADLRAGLRERLRRSPLCDAASLARAIETAYREQWRRWCSAP